MAQPPLPVPPRGEEGGRPVPRRAEGPGAARGCRGFTLAGQKGTEMSSTGGRAAVLTGWEPPVEMLSPSEGQMLSVLSLPPTSISDRLRRAEFGSKARLYV